MDTAKLLSTVPTGLWIGGEEHKSSSTFDVLNPATDEVIVSIANATAEDGIAALDAAAAVQAELGCHPRAGARRDPAFGLRDHHRAHR